MATVVAMPDRSVSIPSAEELVARAKAMIPTLKARAKQCIADRNVSVETIAEMQELADQLAVAAAKPSVHEEDFGESYDA